MFNFFKQRDFVRRLRVAHDALPKSAQETGAKTCARSGRCCWSGPCELAPGDEQQLAAHLSLSVEDLFRSYLVVDYRRGSSYGSPDRLRVMPRRENQDGGAFLTSDQTYDVGACVFLAAGCCSVHKVKPTGGRYYECWNPSTHGSPPGCDWTREQVEAIGWDGEVED